MPDYSQGKIYKLVSPSGQIYVGSTIQPLSDRKADHKKHYNQWKKNNRKYMSSYKLFDEDYENVDIVLIEAFPCNNKDELHKRERHFIDTIKCVNTYKPTRTHQEWINDNREKYTLRRKDHYIKNADTIKAKRMQYYEKNKDDINEKRKVLHECECGGKYSNNHKSRHLKTTKHINFINSH
jgi:hypothetical protein